MTRRPYRQGQTLWLAWTQVSPKGQTEVVVKPVIVVSCLMDVDPDYGHSSWETIVRVRDVLNHRGGTQDVETSLAGMYIHKTFRKAKRTVDEWQLERAQHDAAVAAGTIQEVF